LQQIFRHRSIKKLFLFCIYSAWISLITHKNLFMLNLSLRLKRGGTNYDIGKPILLYGLQRSGTNLIKTVLLDCGVNVVNFSEYPPQSRWNRHFRFRSDSIPTKALANYFSRQEVLKDVATLPKCFIDNNYDYFILIRDFDQWIISIMKWGKKNRWYSKGSSKQDIINSLVFDYIRYLETWISIKQKQRDISVIFLPFDHQSWDSDIREILDLNVNRQDYLNKKLRGSYDYKPSHSIGDDFLLDCTIDSALHARAIELYEDIFS